MSHTCPISTNHSLIIILFLSTWSHPSTTPLTHKKAQMSDSPALPANVESQRSTSTTFATSTMLALVLMLISKLIPVTYITSQQQQRLVHANPYRVPSLLQEVPLWIHTNVPLSATHPLPTHSRTISKSKPIPPYASSKPYPVGLVASHLLHCQVSVSTCFVSYCAF